MLVPRTFDPGVDQQRFIGALDSQRIGVVVALFGSRRAEMDNRRVTGDFGPKTAVDISPKISRFAGPVGEGVDRAPITQRDCRSTFAENEVLELVLHVEDGPLAGAPRSCVLMAGEPTPEDDSCGFGEDNDMRAEAAPGRLETNSPCGTPSRWPGRHPP